MLSLKSVHSGIGQPFLALAYPTVHTFEAEHPTVAIVQMRRDAYPTVDTQGWGRADLSHCAHFWGRASHCGHFTNERSCLSHCGHTRARKGWCVHSGIGISSHLYNGQSGMLSLKSVHSGIGQPFLALVCAQWDRQLFSFVKWPQWDAQPQKCAQWDRSALPRPLCVHSGIGSSSHLYNGHSGMLSLKSVHSVIGQPFLALVCPQWDWQLFSFVKWPQWDAQPQKCAQWDRSALPRPCLSHCAHFWGWAYHCGSLKVCTVW